jgi:large subunit ribosomal protein L24
MAYLAYTHAPGQTNQTIPEYMRPADMDYVEPGPSYIPISSLRLVHPLPDPITGVVRDVIVRQLKPISIVHDRPTRKVSFNRIIPGENVKIPWPKVEPQQKFEYECDTKRAEVEERTFVPTLLTPPMPQSVLDELRGRYSKFRTRHEPEYIAKIEAQEAEKEARKKSAKTMLLPVQELNRKLRAERRALGQPVLTEEMLEKIGQVITKNQAMRAAGKNPVVDNVQKAVEQLLIEDKAAPETKNQPRA